MLCSVPVPRAVRLRKSFLTAALPLVLLELVDFLEVAAACSRELAGDDAAASSSSDTGLASTGGCCFARERCRLLDFAKFCKGLENAADDDDRDDDDKLVVFFFPMLRCCWCAFSSTVEPRHILKNIRPFPRVSTKRKPSSSSSFRDLSVSPPYQA